MAIQATFINADLQHKRVFLRADLNVPLCNGIIKDDYRLQTLRPTLDALMKKNANILIATHIGRPQHIDTTLSTRHLLPWFEAHGYSVVYAQDPSHAAVLSTEQHHRIILLENLRFFPGEQTADKQFAQTLAQLGDYYINDAFATLHRHDSSITLVPQLFTPATRSIGLLVERELHELNKLTDSPEQPFVIFIGGGKAHTKIPLIQAMLGKAHTIILCPAIVCTFLKALNKPTGLSLVDDASIDTCKHILHDAASKGTTLLFPTDYIIGHGSLNGAQETVQAEEFPADGVGISFGPQTLQHLLPIIQQAKTIFYNGLMGTEDDPKTLEITKQLFTALADAPGFTVIGGGDSGAVIRSLKLADKIKFLSTGGGATLALLAHEQLPGLALFLEDRTKTE